MSATFWGVRLLGCSRRFFWHFGEAMRALWVVAIFLVGDGVGAFGYSGLAARVAVAGRVGGGYAV